MSFDPYTLVPVILFPLAMAGSVLIRMFSRRGIKRQAQRALDDVSADPKDMEYRLRSVIETYADSPADADVPMQDELLASLAEVRALHALLCIECGLLELAHQTLAGAEKEIPALALARARLQLARGEHAEASPAWLDDRSSLAPLPETLRSDTHAQLDLARGDLDAALTRPCWPLTRVRVLAAAGRDRDAAVILESAHPSRIDTMCRVYPQEAATRLALRMRSTTSPYR